MESSSTSPAFVVVAGPQASGKSTLATALSRELRRRHERVALVELDLIAAMALPTLPSWEEAHKIFETTAALWLRTELTCVIAEGSGSADEVARLRSQALPGAVTVTVATTAPFDAAFTRAQADPTRGVSKEHKFLSEVYERWPDELRRMHPEVLIDTSFTTIERGVESVIAAVDLARSRHARHVNER